MSRYILRRLVQLVPVGVIRSGLVPADQLPVAGANGNARRLRWPAMREVVEVGSPLQGACLLEHGGITHAVDGLLWRLRLAEHLQHRGVNVDRADDLG